MVTAPQIVLLAQQAEPVLERLDPPRRAAIIMALLGLVLTGLLLVTIAMLGGHWVRRLARHKPGGRRPTADAEAERKNRQLRESLEAMLPDAPTGETIDMDRAAKDTRIDR
jgi:hypothetical protein